MDRSVPDSLERGAVPAQHHFGLPGLHPIVRPECGDHSGVVAAAALAIETLESPKGPDARAARLVVGAAQLVAVGEGWSDSTLLGPHYPPHPADTRTHTTKHPKTTCKRL